jgi:hypothetical protein
VDLRSRLDKLFAYRLSFVMSKYKDERVMFVKLVRLEITEKHLQSTTRSWRKMITFWEIILSVAAQRGLLKLVQLMHDVSINLCLINVAPKLNNLSQTYEAQLVLWN